MVPEGSTVFLTFPVPFPRMFSCPPAASQEPVRTNEVAPGQPCSRGSRSSLSQTLPWPESSAASIGSHVSASFFKFHFDGSPDGLMVTCPKARTRAPTCLYSRAKGSAVPSVCIG